MNQENKPAAPPPKKKKIDARPYIERAMILLCEFLRSRCASPLSCGDPSRRLFGPSLPSLAFVFRWGWARPSKASRCWRTSRKTAASTARTSSSCQSRRCVRTLFVCRRSFFLSVCPPKETDRPPCCAAAVPDVSLLLQRTLCQDILLCTLLLLLLYQDYVLFSGVFSLSPLSSFMAGGRGFSSRKAELSSLRVGLPIPFGWAFVEFFLLPLVGCGGQRDRFRSIYYHTMLAVVEKTYRQPHVATHSKTAYVCEHRLFLVVIGGRSATGCASSRDGAPPSRR